MKKLLLLLLLAIPASAGNEVLLQVTIGSGVTQFTTTSTPVREIIIQNNAAHTMRVGDATTTSSKGIYLAAGPGGGSITVMPSQGYSLDVSDWWVAGTQNDVVDVLYVK